ncbi:MAG: aldehyde oxidase and xanthine dehydrogenase molybdopterin binding protein [Gemmatimonadetes bacterium]|nr:aldehyde oxidase and xanthine dehydrogenase molybdopterin binding protein [Gemmatimonadota bacterium]
MSPGRSGAPEAPKVLGGKLPRIDGPLKVSGRAIYTSDISLAGMLYAVPVRSTIASGRVISIDGSAARKLPGVRAVYYRGNLKPFFRSAPPQGFSGLIDEKRPPFEDDVVRYYGQYVAVAVAQTMEQARAAASAVRVQYTANAHNVEPHLVADKPLKTESERGDVDAAFQSAPVKLDHTYVTPTEVHNPIELHATVATWDGDHVTLYETSQAILNHRDVLYQMLGVPKENVRVITHFLGSGFGGKLWPWTHSIIAAGVAREVGAPVKLVVTRQSMFETVGHRPRTQQRFRIGANRDGKLLSMHHEYLNQTSMLDDYKEDCGESTPFLYSVPNLRVASALSRHNIGTPTAMRGPGAVPGLFAMESAMDELAIALKLDPIELRRRNEPAQDESTKLPFSSRHLLECMQVGAEKFGWARRDPGVGAMKRDGLTIGWGMAACSWGAMRDNAQASVELRRDGTASVTTATQDIGTGTYTVLAIVLAEATGIPLDRIDVRLGDTTLPPGPISGGSWATASVIPAVSSAARAAVQALLAMATSGSNASFKGAKPDDLRFTNGRVSRKSDASSGVPFGDIIARANARAATGHGQSSTTFGSAESKKYSLHSFGAQFAEVTWQPETARLRVSRFVSVIDAGRMINPKPARNQIEGAVVMGIGMALFEHARYDKRYGAPINSNLADYIMSTNADAPAIDVTFLDHPDKVLNELGARGVGEIGLAGTAAAITSAVYHATGVRVRELPVRIEDLLGA